MKKTLVKILSIFLLLSAVQITIIPFLSVDLISPNLLVIFVTFYSLQLKKSHALWLGFAAGLIFDLISGGITGVTAFGLTLTAFITAENRHRFNPSEILSYKFIALVFVNASVFALVTNFLNGFTVNILYAIFIYGLLSGVYTSLFAVPLLFLIPESKLYE